MVGARFGNYRSISLLGEGGMGAVYLAEHPDIGRRVAIKVLRGDLTRDPQLAQRFLNEARAANAIHHPNIIEILDSGTTEDGQPYLVMELLEGETLAARLRRLVRLPLPEALDVAYQTASAVGAAHGKGIVHRDLKPDNLFITALHEVDTGGGRRERVKVLDFGIAKLQTRATPAALVQTRTGTVMGTPAYMSPEQCLGNREVDARSDVYALGIILYEMLCGRPPFVSTGFGELLDMHLRAPVPPPWSLGVDVPEEVQRIIQGALAKRPEDRTQTMTDVQAALRSAAAGLKVGVSSPDVVGHTVPVGVATPPLTPPARPAATTFTTGVGERAPARAGGRPGRRWLAGALVVGAAAATAALLRRRWPSDPAPAAPTTAAPPVSPPVTETPPVPPPTETPPVAPPTMPEPVPTPPDRTVELVLDSHPPQARVISLDDGTLLGKTPLRRRFPAGAPLRVRLEKPGFEPTERTLTLERDLKATVPLRRRRAGAPPRPPTPTPEEPAKL